MNEKNKNKKLYIDPNVRGYFNINQTPNKNKKKMLELIIEFFVYIFGELLFGVIIGGMFRSIKLLGILVLKILTVSNRSIEELEEKYKDSSKPYFIGFGLFIGFIYQILELF